MVLSSASPQCEFFRLNWFPLRSFGLGYSLVSFLLILFLPSIVLVGVFDTFLFVLIGFGIFDFFNYFLFNFVAVLYCIASGNKLGFACVFI